jgi:hypothetical protein
MKPVPTPIRLFTARSNDRYWHFASFPRAVEFGRYRGIADIGGLPTGPTRSRMTHQRDRAQKFAVVHNAASPRTVW